MEEKDTSNTQATNPPEIGQLTESLTDGSNTAQAEDDDSMYDPQNWKKSQNFADDAGAKAILTVRVDKPGKHLFFRVHPDELYRTPACILDLKDQNEKYLVALLLIRSLVEHGIKVDNVMLYTCIDRSGNVFLWPTKLPSDGRSDNWQTSARNIALLAMKQWVRLKSNLSNGCYEAYIAAGDLSEPEWPDDDLKSLMKAAFRDPSIKTIDHDVLKRLRGEN
jgi:hypothetical protein